LYLLPSSLFQLYSILFFPVQKTTLRLFLKYRIVVRIQMLAELEEIIQFKQLYDQPDRQATIRKTWVSR